ncbi:hypothetical protein, partial [Mariniphaga sediminis]|uniref:hypothetical protein n=1 Tax=Mariniphaga sediminis TaxID=1628158 RepID=UPI003566DED4
LHIISQIFTNRGAPFLNKTVLIYSVIGIIILILKEIMDEFFPGKVNLFNSRFLTLRYLSYAAVVTLIMLLGVFDGGQFIYFQF